MRGDGVALLTVAARRGDGATAPRSSTSTSIKRNGQSLPVRLLHRVPVAADGAPGATRTLVLNRSPGEEVSEALRAAEVRFTRFFNNTPIAIAAVDRQRPHRADQCAVPALFGRRPAKARRAARS